MMRIARMLAAIACALSLAACSHVPTRDRSAPTSNAEKSRPTTEDYRRYIKGNVPAFSSARVTDWESPDPTHVVVWTSPAEAYLLTLFGACFGLKSASTILLSADGGVVRPGAAAVMIGSERCAIQFVDRLDARAMKADQVH